jgi:hypothetical protein
MSTLDDLLGGVRSIGQAGEQFAQSYRTVLDVVSGSTPLTRPVVGGTPSATPSPSSVVNPGETVGFTMPTWGWWALGALGFAGLLTGLVALARR